MIRSLVRLLANQSRYLDSNTLLADGWILSWGSWCLPPHNAPNLSRHLSREHCPQFSQLYLHLWPRFAQVNRDEWKSRWRLLQTIYERTLPRMLPDHQVRQQLVNSSKASSRKSKILMKSLVPLLRHWRKILLRCMMQKRSITCPTFRF